MELVSHLDDKLLIAVPKKGRLAEKCAQLLLGADIQFRKSHRLDIAISTTLPVALVFLPAADIPTFVGEGRCALGITGIDQVHESGVDVEDIVDLGFGRCKLQVQVPENSQYKDPKDLVGRTVVTSFVSLADKFFRELEQKKEGEPLSTKIKYVGGSVEAAVALGVGDAIVDLVESGETMRAAGLHAIATVLDTSARLIGARRIESKEIAETASIVRKRILGYVASQKYVLVSYNAPRSQLENLRRIAPGRTAPTVSPLEDEGWCAVSSMVEKKVVAQVMDSLSDAGACDILVFTIDNSRS